MNKIKANQHKEQAAPEEAKLNALRDAIQKGIDSGVPSPNVL